MAEVGRSNRPSGESSSSFPRSPWNAVRDAPRPYHVDRTQSVQDGIPTEDRGNECEPRDAGSISGRTASVRRVQEHWGLSGDPFGPRATSYVPTPVHDEAVARIVHAVESGEHRITIRADAGL